MPMEELCDIQVLPRSGSVVVIQDRDRLIDTGILVRGGFTEDIKERSVLAFDNESVSRSFLLDPEHTYDELKTLTALV